ncbi:uncharacterized protein Tco025E_04184 [Trypanosoma conorhini]|uniref:Uncharacterized protein n=1 Tax=Trypanosoma conorhini TaxID=83891 RepID=A0A422PPI4_9TRYP|nr:uncharacterized protein Tco025E_04184 [Trypanosoma conorhini]RNF19427.1 hypothetical protein Tco025E_04184 [Trypanosoma conorhini]
MPGHQHLGDPALTQNQGNLLGDRPCVRQSRLYREHVGGNTMKELMGQDGLKWDTTRTQGVYAGGRAFDHNDKPRAEGAPADVTTTSSSGTNNDNNGKRDGEPRNGAGEEAVIAMGTEEKQTCPAQSLMPPPTRSATPPPPPEPQQQRQPAPGGAPVAGRAFRPGAGYANRQTYNLFTGE